MAASKAEIKPGQRAKNLVDKHGVVVAREIVDGILTEIQGVAWLQDKIDYYLDVRNGIGIIEKYLEQTKK